jgi:hypothetical protein
MISTQAQKVLRRPRVEKKLPPSPGKAADSMPVTLGNAAAAKAIRDGGGSLSVLRQSSSVLSSPRPFAFKNAYQPGSDPSGL